MWGAAAGQILFSLSPATGAPIALASFNKRDYEHLAADALLITASNSSFSIFGGFVVFSVVGNLAQVRHRFCFFSNWYLWCNSRRVSLDVHIPRL